MCHIDYQSLNVSALSRVNLTALTLKVTLSKDQLIYCYILPNNGLFFLVQHPKSPIVGVTLMLDIYWIDPFKSYKRDFGQWPVRGGFAKSI